MKETHKEGVVFDYKRGEAYLERSGHVVGRLVELSVPRPYNVTLRVEGEELKEDFQRTWIRLKKRTRLK